MSRIVSVTLLSESQGQAPRGNDQRRHVRASILSGLRRLVWPANGRAPSPTPRCRCRLRCAAPSRCKCCRIGQRRTGAPPIAQHNERRTMVTLASSGSISNSKPNSWHIFNIVSFSCSVRPSMTRSPTLRAYSIINCISIQPNP